MICYVVVRSGELAVGSLSRRAIWPDAGIRRGWLALALRRLPAAAARGRLDLPPSDRRSPTANAQLTSRRACSSAIAGPVAIGGRAPKHPAANAVDAQGHPIYQPPPQKRSFILDPLLGSAGCTAVASSDPFPLTLNTSHASLRLSRRRAARRSGRSRSRWRTPSARRSIAIRPRRSSGTTRCSPAPSPMSTRWSATP